MESNDDPITTEMKDKHRGFFMKGLASLRNSRKLILLMVSVGLLLDNMLLTVVGSYFIIFFLKHFLKNIFFLNLINIVPIIPELLYNIRNPGNPLTLLSQEALIHERVPCNYSLILDKKNDDSPCFIGEFKLFFF